MNKSDLQKAILVVISFVLFLICLIGANRLLPENCYLFDDRIQGFLCDGIDFNNPKPCPICEDDRIVSVAQIMVGFGVGFVFLPFIVYAINDWQSRSANQSKLFD